MHEVHLKIQPNVIHRLSFRVNFLVFCCKIHRLVAIAALLASKNLSSLHKLFSILNVLFRRGNKSLDQKITIGSLQIVTSKRSLLKYSDFGRRLTILNIKKFS